MHSRLIAQNVPVDNDTDNSKLQPAHLSAIARETFWVLDFTIIYTLNKGFQMSKLIANYFLLLLRYCVTDPYCVTRDSNRLDKTGRTHFKPKQWVEE